MEPRRSYKDIAADLRALSAELRARAKAAGPGPEGLSANSLATQVHILELAVLGLDAGTGAPSVTGSTAGPA